MNFFVSKHIYPGVWVGFAFVCFLGFASAGVSRALLGVWCARIGFGLYAFAFAAWFSGRFNDRGATVRIAYCCAG